jgi:hypothetical protein
MAHLPALREKRWIVVYAAAGSGHSGSRVWLMPAGCRLPGSCLPRILAARSAMVVMMASAPPPAAVGCRRALRRTRCWVPARTGRPAAQASMAHAAASCYAAVTWCSRESVSVADPFWCLGRTLTQRAAAARHRRRGMSRSE